MNDTFCIFLMGPTAAGKTDLAIALTEYLPCRIISVDSAMVYRGLDIGTAKPSAELLAQVPHALIDICDPSEAYSAARFRHDALQIIEECHQQERIPLLVGGTGLYFRALQQGLSELPSANPELRNQLHQQLQNQGSLVLHQKLAEIDPEAAQRIHPHDPQRIQRALEVYYLTGQPISDWYRQQTQSSPLKSVKKLVIAPQQRTLLHDKIAVRFRQMLQNGLIDEVQGLYQRGDLHAGLPALRAVGYRQVWQYLAGELSYAELPEKAIVATRQLAKRQLTWLRSETDSDWLDSTLPFTVLLENTLKFVETRPNTC
ncbi:tRNA (adenosine(37)-N6)-dimethylallyltransferase MiaA [Thioflexithrix psekupsensis]|uniref:tRNA dimethylallyltransferase n=1 Tax=Thioflexithrix psekupsensis TaxID=1570016 RepID=A0A251X5J9_9GAMM|nr:tRNA (adenosine(37)-N6)-dimethylallyltransferase MiaA [Thioflexithrix psekupsensis]OUD12422.1 tRNA (adenosine(37)-N6)-dimethylallyltransferase MiaA [Thioflexithrix psekupsensis]